MAFHRQFSAVARWPADRWRPAGYQLGHGAHMTAMPTYQTLMNPLLEALRSLGGSATNDEMAARVIEMMALPDEVSEKSHGKGNMTEVEYRLHWARSYLKADGYLENPRRTVWALTRKGRESTKVNAKQLAKRVRAQRRAAKAAAEPDSPGVDGQSAISQEAATTWQEELLETLLAMSPDGFERLCQRILRESGFTEVEVTGRSGDGGIDGHGIIRLAGLISFNVIFQAKRYRSNIGASVVRDFRGAMVGRADKGVIITTAGFTRDARAEATRDGAPPIDLLGGGDLIDLLKKLELGVKTTTRVVEDVSIDAAWFQDI